MSETTWSLGILLAPSVLWAFFGVALGAYVMISAMLSYHWRSYIFHGDAVRRMKRYKRLYFGVSVLLFAGMLVPLLIYSL